MLREDQIQRYSRQILLRAVGGRGQQQLLSTPVGIDGEGAAFAVAAAYLAAGGTPIRWHEGPVRETEVGFLFSRADVGGGRRQEPLAAQNPDAISPAQPSLTLSSASASASLGEIRLCGDAQGARVLARDRGGCALCLDHAATNAPIPDEVASAAGAFAALVSQTLALGRLGGTVRGWRLGPAGSLSELTVEPCGQCASVQGR